MSVQFTGLTSISSSPDLSVGGQVIFTLSFSSPLFAFAPVPSLTLSNGATASFDPVDSSFGAGNIAFSYTVAPGDADAADLRVQQVNNGSSIVDGLLMPVDLSDPSNLLGAPQGLMVDTTPPTVSTSVVPTIEAATAQGAPVTFTATANDAIDGLGVDLVSFNEGGQPVSSGQVFSLGHHDITASAQDNAGNIGSATLSFDVVDTTAPTVSASAPATTEATSAQGAAVTFTTTVADLVDGSTDPVTYRENGNSVSSGAIFGIGHHTVVASATDTSGNVGHATLDFDVVDTTAPTVSASAPATTEATSAQGAAVTFTAVATDIVDGSTDPVTYLENGNSVSSGAVFGIGHHTVLASATDTSGNVGQATLNFDVVDTTAPTVSASAPATTEATSAQGAAVTFTATAADLVDGSTDPVTYRENGNSVSSGAVFAIGHHTVLASATDTSGNVGHATLDFDVVDTTAPTVSASAPATTEATSAQGAAVTFTAVASDVVDGTADPVTYTENGNSVSSGDTFAIGQHTVIASATDTSGNAGQTTFSFDVAAHELSITNAATGVSNTGMSDTYSGPVPYLEHQFLWSGPQGVAITANVPNVFIHGGDGDDALQVTSGRNVLDGGEGSNFLVGGTGADGSDTFFVDARTSAPTWSTIVNFHLGDKVTIWGFAGDNSDASWVGQAGADGFTGATLRAQVNGHDSSITFAGMDSSEASGLSLSTGTVDGQNYLVIARNS
jgi:hypothetical protein